MNDQTFVARSRELGQLQTFLDRALDAQGQICFIAGEAGIGKTALIAEFTRRAQAIHGDLLVAIGNCNAQTGYGDPYLPFREVLGQLTGDVAVKVAQGAISQENANRLRAFLVHSGQALIDVAPDLVDVLVPGSRVITLVGTTLAERFGWVDELEQLVNRNQQKTRGAQPALEQNRLFEEYVSILTTLAAQQPLVIVLDDLQWADLTSISLLFHLARSVRTSRILIIGAYRPVEVELGRNDEQHPLAPVLHELKRYFGDIFIDLGQIPLDEGRDFVDAYLNTLPNRLDESFRQALFSHTEGHPLFVIELLQDMVARLDLVLDQSGRWMAQPNLDWHTLPARVEGVVEQRLDRLEDEVHSILAVASVEGISFIVQVVSRVQEIEERRILHLLSQELEKRHRLVREQEEIEVGRLLLSRYQFSHALFQQYLYQDLSAGERRLLHGAIGDTLASLYQEQTETIAVQLAHHFSQAHLPIKAVAHLYRAGAHAASISANDEAIGHFRNGLEQAATLPAGAERLEQELRLHVGLGNVLIANRGYAAPEVGEAFSQARALSQQLGDTTHQFAILRGLCLYHMTRAQHQMARALAEELLSQVELGPHPVLISVAHNTLGMPLYYMGDFILALDHLQQGIVQYDALEQAQTAVPYAGANSKVSCLVYSALAQWALGYPDQALTMGQAAVTLARTIAHPFSLAFALQFTAILHYLRRNGPETQRMADECIAIARAQNFPVWLSMGYICRGWALVEQGLIAEGMRHIRQGVSDFEGTWARLGQPFTMGILAETYAVMGEHAEALGMVEKALTIARENRELHYEAELCRLQGTLLLRQGESGGAEECFQQAIRIARAQQAKMSELRATMTLAHLWQQQDNPGAGRGQLQAIFDWFTEGFGTPDLIEAKDLLQTLGQTPL